MNTEIGELIAKLYMAGYGEAREDYQGNHEYAKPYRVIAQQSAERLLELGIKLPYEWVYNITDGD